VGRYDSTDGGGRAVSGTATEGNAGSSCRRPTGMWEGRATPGAVAERRESGHRRVLKNGVFQHPANEPAVVRC